MEHSFDVEIAKKYGVNSAVLLKHIYFWIQKNKANDINYHDGTYWTFNSKRAFAEIFPYMTSRQIEYALKRLVDDGVLSTGDYNESKYDRTLWFSITDFGNSILQNCELDLTNLQNRVNKFVKPIPDINTDINTDISLEAKSNKLDLSSCQESQAIPDDVDVEPKKTRAKKQFQADSKPYLLAAFLHRTLCENFQYYKAAADLMPPSGVEKRIQDWAAEFDKVDRIDKINFDMQSEALSFAVQDQFWQQQIKSGANFRKHIGTLLARMEKIGWWN